MSPSAQSTRFVLIVALTVVRAPLQTSTMVPTNHRRELAGALQTDALQGLRDFCAGAWDTAATDKPYCRRLNNATGLPVGVDFNEAVFRMLTSGEGTVRPPLAPCVHEHTSLFFTVHVLVCTLLCLRSLENPHVRSVPPAQLATLIAVVQHTTRMHACVPCMRCQSGPRALLS